MASVADAVPYGNTGPRHRRRSRGGAVRRLLPLAIVAGILVVTGLALQFAGGVFERVGVVAVPNHYVALSLNHAANLPTEAAPGAAVGFQFTISSTRTAAVIQPWTVTTSDQIGQPLLVAHGTTTVGPGRSVTVPVQFPIPQATGIVTVAIGAPGRPLAPLRFHVLAAPTAGAK
jgi:hypothetical protein